MGLVNIWGAVPTAGGLESRIMLAGKMEEGITDSGCRAGSERLRALHGNESKRSTVCKKM